MNVAEYAELAGVSPRRVRALAAGGSLAARKMEGRWVIDEDPPGRHAVRRPLSEVSQHALARVLHTKSLTGLSGQVRARTAQRLRLLRSAQDPAQLLVDWWGGRPPTHLDGGSNLVVHAIAGNAARVREVLHRPRREYLRCPATLAQVVRDERVIQGMTRSELAERAGVDRELVADIERVARLNDLVGLRKILRALHIEPTALPAMDLR
ncbi:helix-turn-helix domain-containing protein [Nocardia sp. NPDC058658]|uniref:helix-turn-helix domain-containing protein n=1 Tax=Nocardia sp. NPDC058658 TaxID=3346580 RepID=UPI003655236F